MSALRKLNSNPGPNPGPHPGLRAANDNAPLDATGNVTTLAGLSFTYDGADQPRAVAGTTSGSYQYDGNLKRVKSTAGGETLYNIYDASGALVHVENASTAKRTDYVSGAGLTLARVDYGMAIYPLHNDHLGGLSVVTHSHNGSVLSSERFTPFGESLINDAFNDNQAGFTGHIKDTATSLNYMQARYQDPVIGRFLSKDPMTFMDTEDPNFFNRYAYAFNDPINLIDPDGMAPESVMDRRYVYPRLSSFIVRTAGRA